ncbi:hypothetical protein AVEN_19108-1 [Araneus ventricosus]|uniref:Uncharacterized protein n=1 Tax=Araneus ventricosus TaxID=182803 RepID=A0A4Y2M492_ARAVE|nr:hypothetical protein AVEN_19108-1 [Araneus ventricosus]
MGVTLETSPSRRSRYGPCCTLNHTLRPNIPPLVWRKTPIRPRPNRTGVRPGNRTEGNVGVVRKYEDGVPAQVPSSSSDRSSKLRGPSQNTLI